MAKQSGGNTAQRVEALVRPTVEGMGLRLWDVVFEKEGPDWYLRVLIDKADGSTMDTDTCADVSHALDPILDEAAPIDQSYYLEVGSPGLGRKLTRPEHYEALKGEKIGVKLIRPNADGVREFAGILKGREGSTVTVETENGTRLSKDELLARGMNQSTIHEDVMVGAEDSHITGKCRDGRTVELFRDGVWVL